MNGRNNGFHFVCSKLKIMAAKIPSHSFAKLKQMSSNEMIHLNYLKFIFSYLVHGLHFNISSIFEYRIMYHLPAVENSLSKSIRVKWVFWRYYASFHSYLLLNTYSQCSGYNDSRDWITVKSILNYQSYQIVHFHNLYQSVHYNSFTHGVHCTPIVYQCLATKIEAPIRTYQSELCICMSAKNFAVNAVNDWTCALFGWIYM